MEAARNLWFLGGIDAHCFDDAYLRQLINDVAPEKAKDARPFRLAVIQLGTYDGTIYNARQVIRQDRPICATTFCLIRRGGVRAVYPDDGRQFAAVADLNENDPGIFVTQSVHKQQAGFSQTSQIHKKTIIFAARRAFVPISV
ncbi:hypothetical protein [Lelliottia amnigena]|uniref:hypothetical protein n=1 Tax=Lelliottia amnigena TaxID=61646 RepID=UPI00345E5FA4